MAAIYGYIPMQWRYRLRIAQDIAQGVAYMHSLTPPIIHRYLSPPQPAQLYLTFLASSDLKSHNVLVTMDDRAKVSG